MKALKVGPFLRYLQPLNGIFSFYAQLNASYLNTKSDPNWSKTDGFSGKLFPALFVHIKNGFGLTFDFGGIEYQTQKQKISNYPETDCSFAFTFGKNLSIGVSKNFGGRKK